MKILFSGQTRAQRSRARAFVSSGERARRCALRILVVIVAVLAAAWVALPQAADDPLDSLKVCKDTQHLILENQFVRVIDDQIPVGVTEPLHRHRHGVVVYVNTYTNEQISQDGKRTVGERKAATASWSDETVHTVKNIGTTPSHAIRIELKY
jgi:hypothetical protein